MITKKINFPSVTERFDELCSRGLCDGLQQGEGSSKQFCVEAAMYMALNPKATEPDDENECVFYDLNQIKIELNDSNWTSDRARTIGLRDLGIAQLGTADLKGIRFIANVLMDEVHKRCFAKILGTPITIDAVLSNLDIIRDAVDNGESTEDLISLAGDTFGRKGDTARFIVAECLLKVLDRLKAPGLVWMKKNNKLSPFGKKALGIK